VKQYVLDTDILIYFLKGQEHVVRRVARQAPEALHTTIVNHAELLYGAYNSVKKSQNLAKVEAFLNRIAILPFCEDASRQFAEHKAALRKKGQGVADMDLMIASISQQRGMVLVVLCQKGWFLAKVRETGWFGGFAIFSRTRAGRRGRAIIEEKPPHSPRPGCHPYGITNFGQEPKVVLGQGS